MIAYSLHEKAAPRITFLLAPLTSNTYLTLDDPVLGRLDQNRLALAEMWHFIADNKLRDGSEPAPVGGMERWDGPVVLCGSGLHACPRALDALKYAPSGAPSGTIQVRLVLLSGIVLADDDKAAASERHILASADCTRELHEFALWCAESVRYLMVDSRSTTALTVKRSWLDGQATDDELAAAWAAAGAAGWAAAGDADWAAQNAELERRLREKLGGEGRGR